MSILDVSKCKNTYITSILDNKKSVDDPKGTASIFNNFLANVGKTTEKEIPPVNHSPSLPGPSRRLAPVIKCRRFLSFFPSLHC